MASDLAQVAQDVHELTSVVQGAVQLFTALSQRLDAAKSDPAAIAAIAKEIEDNKAALAAAIVANTPAQVEQPVVEKPVASVVEQPAQPATPVA